MSSTNRASNVQKNSVQKAYNTRKRSDSVGASPVLRSSAKKRDRELLPDSEVETTSEKEPAPKMSRAGNSGAASSSAKPNNEMAALIGVVNQLKSSVDSLRNDLPTKEDLNRVEENIKKQIDNNTKDINKLFSLREEDKEEFRSKVLEIVEETRINAGGSDQYFLARRSLRLWPVAELAGRLELGCKEFLMLKLDMPEDLVNGITIEMARKIQQPRRSKIEDEVLVRFSDASVRDIVQSYAVNLARHAGKAGIRLEIPPELTGTFRLFEQHAGHLRQRFPEGFKRSIKFDDITRDLIMDIKIPTANKWHRFSRSDIEQASRRLQSSSGTNLSAADTAERLSILHPPRPGQQETSRADVDYVEVEEEDSGSNE